MGCSPDGIIYDTNKNPSVEILEIKSLFSMKAYNLKRTFVFIEIKMEK